MTVHLKTNLAFFRHKHEQIQHTELHSKSYGGCKLSMQPTNTNKLHS